MAQSKEWDWNNAEKEKWLNPSEDSLYHAKKWEAEGARSILDLGCGLGRHAVFFAEKGFKVTAVDLSKDAINFAKEHYAFSDSRFPHIDENTVLKTEGAEVDVPHFFADKKVLIDLFHDYTFEQVRHITDCVMTEDDSKERSHYFIEATIHKKATELDYSKIIGFTVVCTIDRPLGSFHPRHKDLYYPINYGYVNNVFAGDGAEQDVYILGEDRPLSTFTGKVIAVYHRYNDIEDKWIIAAEDNDFTDEEILQQIAFQEKFFDGILVR